jgi:predicted membrane-bound dolichyl-phosphate-mannose-protein mannosyltransferase
MDLYNDGAVGFYVYLAIAAIVGGLSICGIVALSLAASLKAPAILLLPSYLGWVQHTNGSLTLIACVIVFVAI